MNFYQQKYFKPYRQQIIRKESRSPSPYQSPPRQTQRILQTKDSVKQFSRTPIKHNKSPFDQNRSPYKHIKVNSTQEPIWQHLYQRGLKNQKEIMLKHELSKKKIDIQCTFRPQLKQNRRYLVRNDSSFLQRATIWQQNKIEKMMREKQNTINRNLEQCSFKPEIKKVQRKSSLKQLSIDQGGSGKKHNYVDLYERKSHLKEINRNISSNYNYKHQRSRLQPSPSKKTLKQMPLTKSQRYLNFSPQKTPNKLQNESSKLLLRNNSKVGQNQFKDIKKILKQQLTKLNM